MPDSLAQTKQLLQTIIQPHKQKIKSVSTLSKMSQLKAIHMFTQHLIHAILPRELFLYINNVTKIYHIIS